MVDVSKSAIVPYSPQQMLDLVNDVTRYPEFLKGCTQGVIHAENGSQYEASLHMVIKGFKTSFTTRNDVNITDEDISLSLQLIEGPFTNLSGHWRFKALGDLGCRVSLELNYRVRSSMMNQLFAKGFEVMASKMVDDFVKRAEVIYA